MENKKTNKINVVIAVLLTITYFAFAIGFVYMYSISSFGGYNNYPTNSQVFARILLAIGIYAVLFVFYKLVSKLLSKFYAKQAEKAQNIANSINEFVTTNSLSINREIKTNLFSLLVADEQKRFILTNNVNGNCFMYNYSDLLDFEMKEDGDTVVKGRGLQTAVGGLAFGALGALVGASGQRAMTSMCSDLSVTLYLNNLDKPQITFQFINGSVAKTSLLYTMAQSQAKEMIGVLTAITAKSDKAQIQTQTEPTPALPSVADEISKYKHLLDDGAITQDEYDAKKKELLKL